MQTQWGSSINDMAGLGKRHSPLDLTADEDGRSDARNGHQAKQPRILDRDNAYISSPNIPTSTASQNEEYELVDVTQNDEGFGWTEVATIDGKLVGIQYYNGYASPGERVMAAREPSNPYDRNAIRITNVQGNQIGHIPRQVAAKLAPYMDEKTIVVEAILTAEVRLLLLKSFSQSQYDDPQTSITMSFLVYWIFLY